MNAMEKQQPRSHDDECPYCWVPLEIVSVKIGLAHVTMHSICPNCGMVQPENTDETGQNKRSKRGPMSFLRKPG
jgi:hypothetical protein